MLRKKLGKTVQGCRQIQHNIMLPTTNIISQNG